MIKGIVLLADCIESFTRVSSDFIEDEGYVVLKATSLEDAEDILSYKRVHLAILEIRLVNVNDDDDQSGIDLAKNERYQAIPKIIYTAFPTYQNVRAALSSTEGKGPAASAFLANEDGPERLLEIIDQTFKLHVRINFALDIRWGKSQSLSFQYLVSLISSGIDQKNLSSCDKELRDLFSKLFYKYDQVSIQKMYWNKEQRLCLDVIALSEENENQFVVICGQADNIRLGYLELTNNHFIRDQKWISSLIFNETMQYAAFAWIIKQNESSHIKNLKEFLKENSEKDFQKAIKNLFEPFLEEWKKRTSLKTIDKTVHEEARKKTKSEFTQNIIAICNEGKKKHVIKNFSIAHQNTTIQLNNGDVVELPNPTYKLYELPSIANANILYGLNFGGLGADTIIVDQECNAWPTEFSRFGISLVIGDFICLETDIRFNIMEVENLLSLYDFEKELLLINDLEEIRPQANVEPECRNALAGIQKIRQIASQATNKDLLPYYYELFSYSLQKLFKYNDNILHTKQEVIVLIHNLLFCSLLYEKITYLTKRTKEKISPETILGILIDENTYTVQVEGKIITLPLTEFKILLYLYKHPGQLCKRIDILKEGLGMVNPDYKSEKGMLNTNIGRIRKKIEINPSRPKYIKTIRGEGYILFPKPEQ